MQRSKTHLGQNFLQDINTIHKMVSSLRVNPNDKIVEIGGGTGVLSRELVKYPYTNGQLDVYEIDKKLAKILKSELKVVNVIVENFLDANLSVYENPWKVIGSLPYYITSPIVHKLLESRCRPDIIVLLIQKEVAQKIISKPPKSNYWSHIILGYNVTQIAIVPKSSFYPVPKVDSAIIKLDRNMDDEKLVSKIGFKEWSKFLHHGYRSPRKMLKRAIDQLLLEKCRIDGTLRPQNLTHSDWLKLYENDSL